MDRKSALMGKKEIKNEILQLKWNALPVYDRIAYSQEICKEKKIPLKDQLNAQKWQARHNKLIAFASLFLSILSAFHPQINWQLSLFLFSSAVALIAVEILFSNRMRMLKKAVKLRKKLKRIR